jgi:hypothetical protein
MSTRFACTLVAVSTAVFFAAGCAAGPDDEALEDGQAEQASEDEVLAIVETDTVGTEATNVSCKCPVGTELQGGLCFPICSSGFKGEGPLCVKPCATSYADVGPLSVRDAKTIADTSSCPWYNKCGIASDCNKFPAGWTQDGCTCRVDAHVYKQQYYSRGTGVLPTCTKK